MKPLLLAVILWCTCALRLHAIAPLISDVPDQVIARDGNTGTLYLTVGDNETTFAALTLSASSNNAALVPNQVANLQLGGTNAQRTIKVVPIAGQQGTAVITLTVAGGEGLTASSNFTVIVTAPNTPPTLTALPAFQIVGPGQSAAAVSFTVGDAETAAGSLSVAASSSNVQLVPNANIVLGGSGASRSVQVTPLAGQRGTAVIKLRVTDALGAVAQGEFIFSVFDPASANNRVRQPRGIYVLDSAAGTNVNGVSMRDANVRNLPFVDGYVLRTEWATLEPTDGVFDFTIIDHIFTKLPANQKLSLLLASGVLPAWLNSAPGVTTWTAGTPSVTAPVPWNPAAQERYRLLLVALGDHLLDGVPLRSHPRLAAFNPWIPGLKSGIRDPDQARIRDIPGYSRENLQTCVLTHLANATDNFPNVPVQIGFWTYVDNQDASFGGVTPWEQLRQAILAQHDGVARPRVGFWMENLAANRAAAETDPWSGLPNTTFSAPLFLSQESTFVGYQVLGSWARLFSAAHVDNDLNGSPEDGMDYGFNTFQCRYYEHYQADADFVNYAAEFQRWHDFLTALPAFAADFTLAVSTGGTSIQSTSGSALNIALSASGGTGPYAWTLAGGSLPSGVTLGSSGSLSGTPTATGTFPITVRATDANGHADTETFTIQVNAEPPPVFNATINHNEDGSITLTWPAIAGGWYQVEVSGDLGSWTRLGHSVAATTTSMTWTDDGSQTGAHPSQAAKRFYRIRHWGVFTVNFNGNNFTYTDAQRTVTGIFLKPAGNGPFPALIINHGTGGTAGGFGLQRANEMSPWGLACIAANLTHLQGAAEDLNTWGYSPENLARIRASHAVLSTRSDVDLNRLAMWGHSRGAFASIGVAADFGDALKALGFTAGGVLENTGLDDRNGQPEPSYPILSETSGLTAPTIIFHGSTDPIVAPSTSLRLQNLLNTLGIANTRIVYDTAGISPAANAHNLHQSSFYTAPVTGVLAQWRAWLATHGVLP